MEVISDEDDVPVGVIERQEGIDVGPDGKEAPIPRFLVDCVTGETEQVGSTTFLAGEVGAPVVLEVQDRVFDVYYDAEGNADVFNEIAASVNGNDYAGAHTFSRDGSSVTYGDYGIVQHPHLTNVIRSRNTISGQLLWTFEPEGPFDSIHYVGATVVVGQPSGIVGTGDVGVPDIVVVIDSRTGELLRTAPTDYRIIYAR